MAEKELKFVCPKCNGNKLTQICKTRKYFTATKIVDDGQFGNIEFDYANATEDDLDPVEFCCDDCGYQLKDEIDEEIWDSSDAVDWIKKNC